MPRKSFADNEKNRRSVRWEEIKKILSEKSIGTQLELMTELIDRGYDITQGTVSRDVREMNLMKVPNGLGGYRYQIKGGEKNPVTDQFYSLFQNVVLNVDYALNQVVIRTYTGMADAVCASMDTLKFEGVLGTIAGDDTILIITKSEDYAKSLVQSLKEV